MSGVWRRRCEEIGDTRALAVARIGLGLLLADEALRQARELQSGYFAERFHIALRESLVPSRSGWIALLGLRFALAGLVLVGVRARPALLGSAILIFHGLAADRLSFHNFRYALGLFALLLALAPCDRQLAPRKPADPVAPLWAQRLAAAQLSIIYLASAGSKLLDGDWRSGRVISIGVRRFGYLAIAQGAPAALIELLGRPSVAAVLAGAAIATELGLSLGPWTRRARALALWWGVWFHLVIQASTEVASYSCLVILLYALYATPDVRARTLRIDPTARGHRRVASIVRRLDWLARYAVEERAGAALTVIDRDGARASGLGAVAGLARALPILFPLWLPLAALARRRAAPPGGA